VSRSKREPRQITVAEIEGQFELASYWFGAKWCQAVQKFDRGTYSIRVLRSQTIRLSGQTVSYDYFELDADGTITTAPRGHAKDWRPGIVTDIAEAAARYAEPQADALRLNLGGGL
jgi:DNA-binding transcriptional MocR family regulator